MAELTLHFETDQGTDAQAAAAELQQSLPALDGVTRANAKPMQLRTMGGLEIIAVISLAATAVQNTTSLLKAVDDLIQQWQKLSARFPGLRKPSIEIGLRKIPIDQVTENDALEALAE